jgi:hypothetical protein
VRKLIVLAIVFGVALTAVSSVKAAVYYFTPSQPDLNDLDHRYNKSWGIDWSAHSGESITGATLTFTNIYDWQVEAGDILYVHLLDDPTLGIVTNWDDEAGGDNFAGMGPLIGTWTDAGGGSSTGFNLVFNLTADQLASLNEYAADGSFGFGFDPDCHYYNDGIELQVTTQMAHTPEPVSVALFSLGLAGLGLVRRKK